MKKTAQFLFCCAIIIGLCTPSFGQTTPAPEKKAAAKSTPVKTAKPAAKKVPQSTEKINYFNDGVLEFYLQHCGKNKKGIRLVVSNPSDTIMPEFFVVCKECVNTNKNCKEEYLHGKNLMPKSFAPEPGKDDTLLTTPQTGMCIEAPAGGKPDYSFNFSVRYKSARANQWREIGSKYSSKAK